MECIRSVTREGGIAYGNLFEFADVATTLTPENVAALGKIIREYAQQGKVGQVAIAAPIDQAAKLERPFAKFREWHEGRHWKRAVLRIDHLLAGRHSSINSRSRKQPLLLP